MKTNITAVVSKAARPAIWMSAVGATFAFSECVMEAMRNKKDAYNASFGGMAAGLVLGSITRRFDVMTSTALGLGLVMGVFDMMGPEANWNRAHGKDDPKKVFMPVEFEESDELKGLKEKYPKFAAN